MKTMEQWDGSGLSLTDFLKVEDEVDEAIRDYFIGVMPPVTMNWKALQMGEPYVHNNKDIPMYITLEKVGSKWIYTGVKTTALEKESYLIEKES